MDIKLFKGFTPYVNVAWPGHAMGADDIDYLAEAMGDRASDEPGPTDWRNVGFSEINGGFMYDATGAGQLCALTFNERVLPGAVIKEAMMERALEIERREGRKIGKKAFAELKEEVVSSLLPQAFIKRKTVPVLLTKQYILVFSTSAKVCDDVVSMLVNVFGNSKTAYPFTLTTLENQVVHGATISEELTRIARDGQSDMVDPEDPNGDPIAFLESTSNAVLKGEDKETITIKDKSVGATDIQELLKQDYHVTKLGVKLWTPETSEPLASFIVNDKLVVSSFRMLDGVEKPTSKDDKAALFDTLAWLTAKTTLSLVDCLVYVMGGLHNTVASDDIKDDQGLAFTRFDFDEDEGAVDPVDDDEL